MISKEELIKNVAQSCGISPEISSYFFEVFINRLSNKLKSGDLLHFNNFGFFHKRNCRIQLEKSVDSPTAKSYLIQLVLFSTELKIQNDLSAIQFLKIPNLKTLWVDDPDFQKSLKAGDFAPHTDRNQLIKSFATTAEVIIAGLRKDYDSEIVEELIIPLTFDLNFLIKTGQRSSNLAKSVSTQSTDDNLKSVKKVKEPPEEGLPWNYGTKFLEKDKTVKSQENNVSQKQSDIRDITMASKQEADLRKDQAARLKDFKPVSSHLSTTKLENEAQDDVDTVKFSVGKEKNDDSDRLDVNKKFTEVKSKTEAYRQKGEFGQSQDGKDDKYFSLRTRRGGRDNIYRERRNFLPAIAISAFIIIMGIVIYIYFIKYNTLNGSNSNTVYNVKIPSNVNVIQRDFEFAVTYPYPKTENRMQVSGYNRDQFLQADVNPEIKSEEKSDSKIEKKVEISEKPKVEKKNETALEEKPVDTPVKKEEKNTGIFLYKNFYVVHAGTFKSEEAANREADKYFDLGYNAFVDAVELPNRTTEYKLNIGDFTSEEFARQFQEKYIK
jgi:nucleoid DNA-binding protein/cell division septation protein DedD